MSRWAIRRVMEGGRTRLLGIVPLARPFSAGDRIGSNGLRTTLVYTMLVKNVTLSADERLIEAARERARSERTTLNEEFRRWLAEYAQQPHQAQRYDEMMSRLRGKLVVGRTLDRDLMNER